MILKMRLRYYLLIPLLDLNNFGVLRHMYQPLFAQDQLMAEVEEDIEVAKLPMFCCNSDVLRPLNIIGD